MNHMEGLFRRIKRHNKLGEGDIASTTCDYNEDENAIELNNCQGEGDNIDDNQSDDIPLTLMEELMLLGLDNNSGNVSFWNDCISSGLRGCVLIELGFRSRIILGKPDMNDQKLTSRIVLLNSDEETEDDFLDEALELIKETTPPETVMCWIEYLSGESWRQNPLKFHFELKDVRGRLKKDLVEKGILTTKKRNFFLFKITTHPLNNHVIKQNLIKKIQNALLSKWTNDPQLMDERILALIVLAHTSDVLGNALELLNDKDYEVAMKRVRELLSLNFEEEAAKPNSNEVLWAVLASITE